MKLQKIVNGILGCMNVIAMFLVIQTANSACVWIAHQPELPKEAKTIFCKH